MPTGTMRDCIFRVVEPHELISRLVAAEGGAQKVAKKMGKAKLQPTLHKFCAGLVREPNFATARAIAQHFGLDIEAIYDAKAATAAASLRFTDQSPTTVAESSITTLVRERSPEYLRRGETGVAGAVATLAAALHDAHPTTQKAIAVLLAALAESPHDSMRIGEQIAALLASEKQHPAAA